MNDTAGSTFWYSAVTNAGKKSFGFGAAPDQAALAERLRKRDLVLLSAKKLPFNLPASADDAPRGRVPLKDEALLNEQLAVLLERGVTLVEALDVAQGVVSKKTAPRIGIIRERVAAGAAFAAACESVGGFDDVAIGVYRAAERTGDLDAACARLAQSARRRLSVRGKTITVSIYPAVVATVSVLVLFGVLVFLVPGLAESVTQSAEGGKVPAFSAAVFGLGTFLNENLMAVLIFVAALLFGAVALRKQVVAAFMAALRRFKPAAMLLESIELARFFGVLAAMTRSGVPLAEALGSATSTIGEPKLRAQLETLRRELVEGGLLRVLIDRVDRLPAGTRKLLVAAERSGDLDQAFDAMAVREVEEVERRSERLLAFLEPAVLIALFAVVAPLIVAIALPMMNLRTG
jgi:type II secretory pathway component PulF